MQVMFTEPKTGQKKFMKVGFSWMLLFLSPIYGLGLFIRGLILHGLAVFIFCIVVVILNSPATSAFLGLLLIAVAIFYGVKGNELSAKSLIAKGWTMPDNDSTTEYARARWSIPA